jgi:hypothetical protein
MHLYASSMRATSYPRHLFLLQLLHSELKCHLNVTWLVSSRSSRIRILWGLLAAYPYSGLRMCASGHVDWPFLTCEFCTLCHQRWLSISTEIWILLNISRRTKFISPRSWISNSYKAREEGRRLKVISIILLRRPWIILLLYFPCLRVGCKN